MPPGSVIKIPDSLWGSAFWGSALIGAAMRGVRVLMIAPSYDNAPASSFGGMVRSQELMIRMITVSRLLASDIARAGGLLKVGVFATDLAVNDMPGKVQAIRATFERHAWLRTLFNFPSPFYRELGAMADSLGRLPVSKDTIKDFEGLPKPKLHLKANYFASSVGWSVMSRPEWATLVRNFVRKRMVQGANRSSSVSRFVDSTNTSEQDDDSMVQQWYAGLSPRDSAQVVFYTIMGSHNQNARSMVTDGEDAFIVSNWLPVIPYIDLLTLVGQCRWVEEPSEVDALFPHYSTMWRRLAHWGKLVF